jgi:hypothetical protein
VKLAFDDAAWLRKLADSKYYILLYFDQTIRHICFKREYRRKYDDYKEKNRSRMVEYCEKNALLSPQLMPICPRKAPSDKLFLKIFHFVQLFLFG